jgi:hypothetical protein
MLLNGRALKGTVLHTTHVRRQDWEHTWVVQNAWKQFGCLCREGKVRIHTRKGLRNSGDVRAVDA